MYVTCLLDARRQQVYRCALCVHASQTMSHVPHVSRTQSGTTIHDQCIVVPAQAPIVVDPHQLVRFSLAHLFFLLQREVHVTLSLHTLSFD